MPHLTLPIGNGGPIVELVVGASASRTKALQTAGKPVPAQIKIRALVDTGASCTCLDLSCIQKLGLTPTGIAQVHTPTTDEQPESKKQYDVSLLVVLPGLSRRFAEQPVIEANLTFQGIQALIGRDMLKSCLLVYDGQEETFALAF